MGHRSDIDGLRAVAVLSVLLFHAKLASCSGGFVGVDVFFVISGFLITSIILSEMRSGSYSILDFYERRVRRIIPMLVTIIAVTAAIGCWLFLPQDLRHLGEGAASAALFSSNIFFCLTTGYFEHAAALNPLLHTWSLAVEEQFYLLFPLILFLSRAQSHVRSILTIGSIGIVSFAASVWLTAAYPTFSFYMLPTRAWELMLGGMLCLWKPSRLPAPALHFMSVLGLGMIIAAAFVFSVSIPFPGVAAALPCAGAALIIYSGTPRMSLVGRILSTKPLVWTGLISYSLYLWHWPVLVFTRYVYMREPPTTVIVVAMLGAVLLSIASYRFIEVPYRRKRGAIGRVQMFAVAAAASFAVLIAGLVIFRFDGFPSRMPPQVLYLSNARRDHTSYREHCLYLPSADITHGRLCDTTLGAKTASDPSFVLWGDSHADALSPALAHEALQFNMYGIDGTLAGCPPILSTDISSAPDCRAFNNLVLDTIWRQHIRTVILAARWALYLERGYSADYDQGAPVTVSDAGGSGPSAFVSGLQRTIAALFSAHVRVVLVGPAPEVRYDVPSVLARQVLFHDSFPVGVTRAEFDSRQKTVQDVIKHLQMKYHFDVVQPSDRLCDHVTCLVQTEGFPLYYDSHHLSTHGAEFLAPLFAPIFARGRMQGGGAAYD
jgi:peptidoglycan/LPS O-acetylase OafA/YrhL